MALGFKMKEMSVKVNKNQGTNIILDMLEQVGAVELLEEIVQQMSSDELSQVIDGLDQYLFDNYYQEALEEEPDAWND